MTDAQRTAGSAAYRGFLFSDVRGFTAFAERYGNSAAAEMVGRFLEIARTAIARHQGAEIKTEGDAIHAVFPSASGAVLCGLEIVDAAAELNAAAPDRPLGLGVGIHAGEAVETAEGYIGRAVNIAARLCAEARAGEVLVSSTVKGITQASIQVGFIPRGTRRLKGIQDPILVYSVTRDMTARAPRAVPRWLLLAAAALVGAVVVSIGTLSIARLLSSEGPNPKATPTESAAPPTARPIVIGALPFGDYTSTQFQPPVGLRIEDQGWAASRDLPDMLALEREATPRGSVFLLRVGEVMTSPCVAGEEGGAGGTGPRADDILDQLDALEHITLENRKPTEVSGLTGEQADVLVADGALAACGGLVGAEVPIFGTAEETWRASPGERFRVFSVAVGDQAVTILVSADWSRTPAVQEVENLLMLGQRIVDSVRF